MTSRRPLIGISLAILTLSSGLAAGCASSSIPEYDRGAGTDKYDTVFPSRETGDLIEQAFRSVRMVNSVAYYAEYTFRPVDAVRPSDLSVMDLKARSLEPDFFRDTSSGTGIVLRAGEDRLALLTSAHVVHFADTILTLYEPGPDGEASVRTAAIKERQVTYLPDVEGADKLEIAAIDPRADLAVIGQQLDGADRNVSPLQFATGQIEDLQWGSFVYVLGYPAGVKMVTRGLTSRPVADNLKSFVIDATFNNGFSGGAVFAIRDGVPNLEWVGMATSSAALTEWTLMPSVSEGDVGLDPGSPFQGDIFAVQKKRLRYGITICVSADAVVEFLERHADELVSQGFRVEPPR